MRCPQSVRVDLRPLNVGFGHAQQVIKEHQVLGVCVANLDMDLGAGCLRIKTLD